MRPSREEILMAQAGLVSYRGTCPRAQVGAVLARDGRILSTGYNGAPAGMPHCVHDVNLTEPCVWAVHAETNAISFAAKYGVSTDHTELFTTLAPCLTCAKLIINSGIGLVYYGAEYTTSEGLILLQEAKITVIQITTATTRLTKS